ncbi:periplasmic nitrate reductase cytochrome c-type protein [Betaproteobacteria bacterium]|nr:periplasmic nitrate reductase cytochrome c-type protein [Betaproteobacteria bacterium]GHT97949.1 periplasmic nitrate reductase cytochrome c-type protein [Betaproteobacteria bacterium]GHU09356.1 periplasmic nitrate reductase cytochrome c-type protein [Betaproteobacteria bacterium]GHU29254.1 periplasmic nitrate reductase cytochrome c-type protein [Betaproteobacteria bacterium]
MKSHLRAFFPAALLAGLMLFPVASFGADDGGLATLRGVPIPSDAAAESADTLKKAIESVPFDREFIQQPPLVSHAIDEYPITIKFNKCLDCHSWEKARAEKATKVSQTHFKGRDGVELPNVSPSRYFCVQCHVPQVDAKPLIANTYQRPAGLRR